MDNLIEELLYKAIRDIKIIADSNTAKTLEIFELMKQNRELKQQIKQFKGLLGEDKKLERLEKAVADAYDFIDADAYDFAAYDTAKQALEEYKKEIGI
jgi:hypothetical protein